VSDARRPLDSLTLARDRPALEAVVIVCSLALLAPLVWPLLTGRIFATTDLGFFHLPMRAIYRDGLHAGYWPIWTPALFAGFYAHGEGQTGMFHPLHVVLYRTLPLGIAFNLEFLASYLGAFAGMYWLLRRLRLMRAAALFGAMLFAFSGFQLLHFLHMNLVAVAAHTPWLLASIDVAIAEDRPSRRAAGMIAIACVLASAVLIGFPQAVWWNLLAAAWFAPLRAFELRRGRRLVPCAFALLCGALMGAVQLLPTLDLMRHSVRAEFSRSFAFMYSLHPYNVLQLWSPYVFKGRVFGGGDYPWIHELGVYSGAILIVALPWLWIRRVALRPRATLVVGTAAFALVMFVLALGRYGYLDVPLTYLPGIGSLRAPVRYILLTQFALAILVAIVFEDLASRDGGHALDTRDVALISVPLILSVLTAALVSTHLVVSARMRLAPLTSAIGGTLIVAAVTGAVLLAAMGRRWALPLLVLLTAADLGLSGLSYVYELPPQTVESQSAGAPPAEDPQWRVVSPEVWGNRLLLKHYRLAVGYAGLFPTRTLPYKPFQRLASVRDSFAPDSTIEFRPDAIARARLLADVKVTSQPALDIDTIDLQRTALVAEPLPPLAGGAGTASVATDRPGRIVVDTVAPGPKLLSISERFDEGWTATADGRPLRVLRINGDFLGCLVDGGAHRIELRFAPRSFSAGALVSAIGVAALAIGAFVFGRTRDV
jgi:hypothetical protein